MHKSFYLICPTDFIENTINKTFGGENYFYTSLGNSFNYESKTLEHIKAIIKKHNIKEIYFVLSLNNIIVLDALTTKKKSKIRLLHNFYNDIKSQKERSQTAFKENDNQFTLLSLYLNKKIKELRLANLSSQTIKIGGKIYHKDQDTFTNIYSDLVCLEKHNLN